ncbi:UDP-N-acetylmuramoyl-L-alanyl-D-glutamate--2,6-diaminopimelate ligase, partial [candidate division FCPU426 bacterium]|nr:UDP-N-acetylmuramoyl-L-alanyl-D-glutamate--2,6-diaminopimelate ligase [candidate division FCPU426 bacterium]
SVPIKMKLLGRHNIANALAAAAAAHGLGLRLPVIAEGLQKLDCVPGRMERIPGRHPFAVLVDYAHTPDALEKVLRAARDFTSKRLIVVFGCGGNRDQAKRGPMGAWAATLADITVITSDNPRQEDPRKIIGSIVRGYQSVKAPAASGRRMQVEPDRMRAIAKALAMARPGDTVLIAGKGHEQYQLVKNRTIRFDDRLAAAAVLMQAARR